MTWLLTSTVWRPFRLHAALSRYVSAEWGSIDGLRMQIMTDFFKHGFDGSGKWMNLVGVCDVIWCDMMRYDAIWYVIISPCQLITLLQLRCVPLSRRWRRLLHRWSAHFRLELVQVRYTIPFRYHPGMYNPFNSACTIHSTLMLTFKNVFLNIRGQFSSFWFHFYPPSFICLANLLSCNLILIFPWLDFVPCCTAQ